MYNLPDYYKRNLHPVDFDDEPQNVEWQPEAYDIAFNVAESSRIKTIIDLGCGQARKLIDREFPNIIAVDRPAVIAINKRLYPESNIQWVEADFLSGKELDLPFKGSLVLCSDVIEHLVDPEKLISLFRYALDSGAPYVVVSTPDRYSVRGPTSTGPPENFAHVQEWSLVELHDWFQSLGFHIMWAGLTQSNTGDPFKGTSVVILASESRTNV